MGSVEWTVIGTGFVILTVGGIGYRVLHSDLTELRHDVGELRERMARLEGLFEGFTKRESGGPAHT